MRLGSYEVGRASSSGSTAVGGADSQLQDLSHLPAKEQLYAWWYTITPGLRSKLLSQGIGPNTAQGLYGMVESEAEALAWAEQLAAGEAIASPLLAGVLWRLRQAAGLVAYGVKIPRTVSKAAPWVSKRISAPPGMSLDPILAASSHAAAKAAAKAAATAPYVMNEGLSTPERAKRKLYAETLDAFGGFRHRVETIRKVVGQMEEQGFLQSALVLRGAPKRAAWATIRTRWIADAGSDVEVRNDIEDVERRRWTKELALVLEVCNMPIWDRAFRTASDPHSLLRYCAGKAHTRTIRRSVRHWNRFQRWKMFSGLRNSRPVLGDALRYLLDLLAEPCARTEPSAFSDAVEFVEIRGGVTGDDMISRQRAFIRMVQDMTLLLSSTALPTAKPVAYMSVMVMALELYVGDSTLSAYKRAIAWVKLLRIWTAMRRDDVQGLLPQSMVLGPKGLEATLDRTKTIGLGRKARWMSVFVSAKGYLLKQDWLEEGLKIWHSKHFCIYREYLVPLPADDYEGVRNARADYTDMVAMNRSILRDLTVPVWDDVAKEWSRGSEPLLEQGLASLWTEHSERNWLKIFAARLGFDKSRRDYLGHWSPERSEVHSCFARDTVFDIQDSVAHALRNGDSRISEKATAQVIAKNMQGLDYTERSIDEQLGLLDISRYQGASAGGFHVPIATWPVRVADRDRPTAPSSPTEVASPTPEPDDAPSSPTEVAARESGETTGDLHTEQDRVRSKD